ncbi:immunity protein Tsi6 family protein [Polyangium sorediatum]|uniref:Immunity protein Tsi6 family protein n=1 Tax=Polyangium sorediatum TaxID=889274 RepID=A0ABT6P736_9BACT|nr:immunity protein Tsi6 family protein [Polyangium sorediatum]MDI1436429.1 immunity protein Tsi6 family protein [Polyangium sorediatum]
MNRPIDSRKEFFEVLEQTRIEAEARFQRAPRSALYESIARQLAAMQSMTESGRTPTEDERESITIGLLAARELEPAQDPDLVDFIERLHELNGYFTAWPPN